jgi:hypothetical protein
MSLTPDAPTPPPAPTPPLFLFGDGHYPDIYASAEALCGRIEGIDLLEGDYRAYDSLGRHVQLEAVGVRRSGRWVDVGETVVAGVEDSPAHREEFRRLLTEFLSRETEGSTLARMSLAELVGRCAGPSSDTNQNVRTDFPCSGSGLSCYRLRLRFGNQCSAPCRPR